MAASTLLFDVNLLQQALAQGALVLTPNRRLASRIRLALAAQHAVAPAAAVFALADWLQQLWQQMLLRADPLAAGLLVLSNLQEQSLWEQAVRAGDTPLLRPGQAAEQAQSAYRTLALWRQLPLREALRDECAAQADSAMFIEWCDRFERSCVKRAAIAAAERDRRVVDAVLQQRIALPRHIVAVGFDDMPPLYRALMQAVEHYRELELPNRLQHAAAIGFDSLETQLQAAALWAQRQLQKNPAGPVAIVVPELNQQRALVERVLLDVLTPEHALPQRTRELPPLNFSAGEALAQTPPIRAALQLLELAAPAIELEALLQLLRSPFHLAADNHAILAHFIERICALRVPALRSAQLRQCAEKIAHDFPEWPFAAALQQLAERSRRERWLDGKFSARRWCDIFSEILLLLGWPGTRTLDSIEYQQHAHWQQLLLEFAQFDQIAAPCDFNSALQKLRQFAQAQIFQAQTSDTPLQVLGVLEAAGLQFQALWLCDMGDDRWPAPASPQALLPYDLQRRLRMPRCDAEREFAIAQRLTTALLASAHEVIVSYQSESEEIARHISPLFASLTAIDSDALLGAEWGGRLPANIRRREILNSTALEDFEPGQAPALIALASVRGGSALLKDQAACAFRAFAVHRLRARALEEPVAGLDAAERGSILHRALEIIWSELRSQAALLAMRASEEADLLIAAANTALQDFAHASPQRLGLRFHRLESERLQRVLRAWLDVERERAEFSVHALELSHEVALESLTLRVRADRIDRLADGRFLIVDYKTKDGNCNVKEWLGDRPDEPQLPLYAQAFASEQGEVAAVAFAQVRLEKPQWVGAGDAQSGFDMPAYFSDAEPLADWSELQTRWRSVLETLAQQFIAGQAEVDPKARNTCDFCALDAICRIHHEQDRIRNAYDADVIVADERDFSR